MPNRQHHRSLGEDFVDLSGDDDVWNFMKMDLGEEDLEFGDEAEALLDDLAHLSPDYPVVRRRWVLRAWRGVRPERVKGYLQHNRQNRLLSALGINLRGAVDAALQRQLIKLEEDRRARDNRPPFGNAAAIAAALGLAPLERELLLLVAMMHLDPTLYVALKPLGEFTRRGACAASRARSSLAARANSTRPWRHASPRQSGMAACFATSRRSMP